MGVDGCVAVVAGVAKVVVVVGAAKLAFGGGEGDVHVRESVGFFGMATHLADVFVQLSLGCPSGQGQAIGRVRQGEGEARRDSKRGDVGCCCFVVVLGEKSEDALLIFSLLFNLRM